MSLKSSMSRTVPQVLAVLIVLLSLFSSTITFAWSSPAIPKLLSPEFPLQISKEDVSFFITMGLIGMVVGSLTCSLYVDKIGRKYSFLLLAPVHLLVFILLYFCTVSINFVHVARFIAGVLQVHSMNVVGIYICEISEPRIRGILTCLVSAVWNLGIIFINLVGYNCSLQTTSLIMIIFPCVFLVLSLFVPESPYYLLMKDKVKASRQALITLRGTVNVEAELAQLQIDVKRQLSERGGLKELLLVRSNRRACLVTILLIVMEIFSGHAPLTVFSQNFFVEATDVLSAELATSYLVLLQTVFVFVAMFIIDRFGRRILTLVPLTMLIFCLLILSAYFLVKDYYWAKISDYSWITIIVMMVYKISFTLGLASVTPCMKGELLALNVKAVGNTVTSVGYALSIFGSTELYQYFANYSSTGWSLLIFAGVQIVGFGLSWRYLPETKGKTLEEIQEDLMDK